MSAVTNYEGGFLAHAITMRADLFADAVLGLILVASPWLFGFADEGANAWMPCVLIGLMELGAAALTTPFAAGRSSARARLPGLSPRRVSFQARASWLGGRSYFTSESILNIGRYIEMMITPTMQPTPIIISGSMIEVSEEMDASTSSS